MMFMARNCREHRRREEAAVESKGPIVVGALQARAGALAALDDLRTAMRTGINEGADLAVGAAHDDQWHAYEIESEVAARLGHPALTADAVPVAEESPLAFTLIEPRRGVTPSGQGLGGVPAT